MKAKVLILAVLIGASSFLYAQPVEKGNKKSMNGAKGETRMERTERPNNGLNLTDEQKESFKKGMIAMQKEMKPLRNEMGELIARQKTLVSADQPDIKAINKNLDKIGEVKTQMAKIQVKNQLDMRAQLTEEQQLKFDMFKAKMKPDQKGEKDNMKKGRRG